MSFTRRSFNKLNLALIASLLGISRFSLADRASSAPIPLILDTDIGDDLDDTWALMMLLRSANIDVKLITTGLGNTRYRTRLLAKLLHQMGHVDIPLGIGLDADDKPGNQSDWLDTFQLDEYPGKVHQDGVQAMIDLIMQSPVPITVLCISPAMNIAEALKRQPAIAENARFVGMHGSIRVGYDGKDKPVAEWNVRVDPKALQSVFAAPWDCTIAPLDTCGLVQIKGENYQSVLQSNDPWMKILIDNYQSWLPKAIWLNPRPDPKKISSTLFDTVAVHLVQSDDYLTMEDLPLRVTDDGFTVIDEHNGRIVHCATGWQDQAAFESNVVEVLTLGSQL